jgi:hypothetical protein
LNQSEPPDELVVAIDNPDDDTLSAVQDATRGARFPVRIIELVAGRPGPDPASAHPDQCLFHAARGDILVHLDDDCRPHPDLCRRIRVLLANLPRQVIWLKFNFVNHDGSPLTDYPRVDSRIRHAEHLHWPILAGGIIRLPSHGTFHWGAAWCVPRREILAIGGHCLALARFRNSDTRLGSRLVAAGCDSFVGATPELTADHLGPTWYQVHQHDRRALRESRGPTRGRTIANGGLAFWNSSWIQAAYNELDTTTTSHTI